MTDINIQTMLRQYREAAIATSSNDSKQQNKSADIVHVCYKSLRTTLEGREGIAGLMADTNPQVRLWAASHSLAWSTATARNVLESLRDNQEFPSSFTAQLTLSEFDNGSLSFDY